MRLQFKNVPVLREALQGVQQKLEDEEVEKLKALNPNTPDVVLRNVVRSARARTKRQLQTV